MKTDEEIETWLADHMPDGPETPYQQGTQDALDWATGHSSDLAAE